MAHFHWFWLVAYPYMTLTMPVPVSLISWYNSRMELNIKTVLCANHVILYHSDRHYIPNMNKLEKVVREHDSWRQRDEVLYSLHNVLFIMFIAAWILLTFSNLARLKGTRSPPKHCLLLVKKMMNYTLSTSLEHMIGYLGKGC